MKITLSVFKADVGSIGGHIAPSRELFKKVKMIGTHHGSTIIDSYVSYTGDDIAIVMTHTHGIGAAEVRRIAWDAFTAGMAPQVEPGDLTDPPKVRHKIA